MKPHLCFGLCFILLLFLNSFYNLSLKKTNWISKQIMPHCLGFTCELNAGTLKVPSTLELGLLVTW